MTRHFVIFDKRTGEIVHCWTCPALNVAASFLALAGGDAERFDYLLDAVADGAAEYVDTNSNAIVGKTPFAPEISGNVISNLPEGTHVLFTRTRQRVTVDASEELDIEVEYAAPVEMRLKHPRHLTATITVDCT